MKLFTQIGAVRSVDWIFIIGGGGRPGGPFYSYLMKQEAVSIPVSSKSVDNYSTSPQKTFASPDLLLHSLQMHVEIVVCRYGNRALPFKEQSVKSRDYVKNEWNYTSAFSYAFTEVNGDDFEFYTLELQGASVNRTILQH